MADTKTSLLTELTAPVSGDWVPIVDVSDTTQAASGTTKKLDWDAIAQGAVNVDTYGAGADDGSTNEYDEISAGIAAAGVNGIVRFTPGKTYVSQGWIAPLQGQTLILHGAIIKRSDQVSSTTETDWNAGTSSFTLASTAGLGVGDMVTIWNGVAFGSGSVYTSPVKILTMPGGNVITTDTIGASTIFDDNGVYSGGNITVQSTVFTSNYMIRTTASDVTILGGEFDGNASNNPLHPRWTSYNELLVEGARSTIDGIYVHDAPVEAVLFGGDGSKIINSRFVDIGGNGIHWTNSASTNKGGQIANCYFENTNTDAADTGHENGAVAFSNEVHDLVISGNICYNARAFVGGFSSSTRNITISDNYVEGSTLRGIDMSSGFAAGQTGIQGITVSNNIIKDSANSDGVRVADSLSTDTSAADATTPVTSLTLQTNDTDIESAGHGLAVGDYVEIAGTIVGTGTVLTILPGIWRVTEIIDVDNFTIGYDGTTTGTYTSGATWGVKGYFRDVNITNNVLIGSNIRVEDAIGANVSGNKINLFNTTTVPCINLASPKANCTNNVCMGGQEGILFGSSEGTGTGNYCVDNLIGINVPTGASAATVTGNRVVVTNHVSQQWNGIKSQVANTVISNNYVDNQHPRSTATMQSINLGTANADDCIIKNNVLKSTQNLSLSNGITIESSSNNTILDGNINQGHGEAFFFIDTGGVNTVWNGTQRFTAAGAISSEAQVVELDNTAGMALTIANANMHHGIFKVIPVVEPAGTPDHTITLTAGTWNGTNAVATFADITDYLEIYFDSDGNGTVISNPGSVAFSA